MVKASVIHHMNVIIDNVDKARDFYGRVLGLPEITNTAMTLHMHSVVQMYVDVLATPEQKARLYESFGGCAPYVMSCVAAWAMIGLTGEEANHGTHAVHP